MSKLRELPVGVVLIVAVLTVLPGLSGVNAQDHGGTSQPQSEQSTEDEIAPSNPGDGRGDPPGRGGVVIVGPVNVTDTVSNVNSTSGLTLFGHETAEAVCEASTSATGFESDPGRNFVVNLGDVSAVATSEATNSTGEITLLDFSEIDAQTSASAFARGIDAGTGKDLVINDGSISATASATARSLEIGLDVVDAAEGDASIEAQAQAVGIRGGTGKDAITNRGTVTVNATSQADVTTVEINGVAASSSDSDLRSTSLATGVTGDEGKDDLTNAGEMTVEAIAKIPDADTVRLLNLVDAAVGDSTLYAGSGAFGMTGGTSKDVLVNAEGGSLSVHARSEVDTTSVELNLIDATAGDMSITAQSYATGLDGGHQRDIIENHGSLSVTAEAESDVVSVNVSLIDLTLIGALTGEGGNAETILEADATGMDGGDYEDQISNSGSLGVTATTDAVAVSVSASSEGLTGALTSLDTENILASVGTTGRATATGMDGGHGDDTITNEGIVNVHADSYVEHDSANLGISTVDLGIPTPAITLGSAGSQAEATAAGIVGGSGQDTIQNDGEMHVRADAEALAITGTAVIQGTGVSSSSGFDLFGFGLALADSTTVATAGATGISGGEGFDAIDNTGMLDVDASATTTTVSASVNILPDVTGIAAIGVSASDTSSKATSTAVGIDGRGETQYIDNTGTVTVDATSEVDSWSVALDIGAANKSVVTAGAALSRSQSEALSEASGILGGTLADQIDNSGDVIVYAHSDVTGVALSAEIQGNVSGYAGVPAIGLGGALTDASTTSTARAAGIDGGTGADVIVNSGVTDVEADADAVGVAVSLGVQGQVEGLSVGAAVSNTSTTADAGATAIDGGANDDLLINEAGGEIYADALADATAVSVGVEAQITVNEDAVLLGGALSFAGSTGIAQATAVDGASGQDTIRNDGLIESYAEANADSVAASLGIQGVTDGAGLQFVLSDTSGTATATATGIAAGTGNDHVIGSGDVSAHAKSDVDAVSVSAGITVAENGFAAVGSLADSSGTGTATARAIDGGAGQDVIAMQGDVDAMAESYVDTTSVGVTIAGTSKGLSIGAALSDSSGTANALAVGIDAGDAADAVDVNDDVSAWSKADVDSTGVSVGLTIANQGVAVGASLSRSTANGTATARAIDGGAGQDVINVDNGDDEADVIVASTAESYVDATSVSVTLAGSAQGVGVGAALTDSSATAVADATGIAAGNGNDDVSNRETVSAYAKSDVAATSVGVGFTVANQGVAVGAALSDSSATGTATARAIDGGAGQDVIRSHGLVDAKSEAFVDATSVSVNVSGAANGVAVGAALTDSSATATADATGIAAGDDNDEVTTTETVRAKAKTDVDSTSASVGVTVAANGVAAGASLSDSSGTGTAIARGIDGGKGEDTIVSQGVVEAISESYVDAVSVGVTIDGTANGVSAGAALTDSSATAIAEATGIAAGDDNDEVTTSETVRARAKTDVDAISVSAGVSVTGTGVAAGASLADSSAVGTSVARAIDGGAGQDTILSDGTVEAISESFVDATSVSVGVSVSASGGAGGLAMSDSSAEAEAESTGIDGGDNDDQITSEGAITASSTTDVDSTSASVQISGSIGVGAGASLSDSSVTAISKATGIDGGSGDDQISNVGEIDASAVTTADATSVSISGNLSIGVGGSVSDSSVTAVSDAIGISGSIGSDDVLNSGTISAWSSTDAETDSVSVTVGLLGVSVGDASTTSTARAAGIDSGADDDTIQNDGDVIADSRSNVKADSTSINIGLGWDSAEANVSSETTVLGIAGGAGDDEIVNTGTIRVGPQPGSDDEIWMSNIDATSFSLGIAGATEAASTLTAKTESTGIDGGGDNDHVTNEGSVNVTATSRGTVSSSAIGIFGTSDSAATVTAETIAIGLDGGDGDDVAINRGPVTVTVKSSMSLDGSSFEFGGTTDLGGALTASTQGAGISGGSGMDQISNEGAIVVTATSVLDSVGGSSAAFGTSDSSVKSGATTRADGIDAGDNDDTVDNLATIDVTSESILTLDGSSFTFGGTGDAGGSLNAATKGTGIGGGSGVDDINNTGVVTVLARSELHSTGDSDTAFGTAGASGASGAITEAAGIDGGDDDDTIDNFAAIGVTTESTLTMHGSSYTFGGTGEVDDSLTSSAFATGILGGDGLDVIHNEGAITVSASSDLESTGESETTFGTSDAGALITSEVTAAGIDGGDDDDTIDNLGAIDVRAVSDGNSNRSSFTFGGGSASDSVLKTISRAFGITGGEGSDDIVNSGSILVDAVSSLTANGKSRSTIAGSASSVSRTNAEANATGIDGGIGGDSIDNQASIVVGAFGDANSADVGDAGWLFGSGQANSRAQADASGSGIDAGDGDNDVVNGNDILVTTTSQANAYGTASGAIFDGDATVWAGATASVQASGIASGAGNDVITNDGTITVTTTRFVDDPSAEDTLLQTLARAETWSNGQGADGDGRSGWGKGTGDGPVKATVHAEVSGISAGDGNNEIFNEGIITVTADPRAEVYARTDGDAFADADGFGWAVATARAFGIWTGVGEDTIVNDGTIVVTAHPTADSYTKESRDCCFGDNEGFDWVDVESLAIGIRTGGSNNTITNNGTLTVTADAYASARDTGDSNPAYYYSLTSTAIGIQAVDGSSYIENNGDITVAANASALHSWVVPDLTMIAIQTGSADDVIFNLGNISATFDANGVTGLGTAIDSGGGDDWVYLGTSSVVEGHIDLGGGDDSLTVAGDSRITGTVTGNTGFDSLILVDRSWFGNTIEDFERLVKDGRDTTTLPDLPFVQQIAVTHGILEVSSDCSLQSEGRLETWVHGDGSAGQFQVDGTATLDGDLLITPGEQAFVDGTRFDVLTADAFEGEFVEVILPESKPLLSFELNRSPTAFEIAAFVEPFQSVAMDPLESTIAGYMDQVLPTVEGDASIVLGAFQRLDTTQFDNAFSSLSPEVHDGMTGTTLAATSAYLTGVQQRMDLLRTMGLAPDNDSVAPTASGATPSRGTSLVSVESWDGFWLNGVGQSGAVAGSDGFGGFDYTTSGYTLGYDRSLGNKLVGGTLGVLGTNVDYSDVTAQGDVETLFGTAYGGLYGRRSFVQSVLSYARHGYNSSRVVEFGDLSRQATADHDGNAIAAVVSGGFGFGSRHLSVEPLGSLNFIRLYESGYEESGAGSAGLSLESRTTNSLISDLGVRFAGRITAGKGKLVPELMLSWSHDWGIDEGQIQGSFTDVPGVPYTVDGRGYGGSGTRFGTGLTYFGRGGWDAGLRYFGYEVGNHSSSGLVAQLHFSF